MIHGDFSGDHLLINEVKTKLNGVIDFSDRAIDDAAVDFARLWSFGPTFVRDVYSHYRGKKDPRFIDRSKLYRLLSQLYTLYGAVGGHEELKQAKREFEENFIFE